MSTTDTHAEHDRRRLEAERVLARLRETHGPSFPDAEPSACRWSFKQRHGHPVRRRRPAHRRHHERHMSRPWHEAIPLRIGPCGDPNKVSRPPGFSKVGGV